MGKRKVGPTKDSDERPLRQVLYASKLLWRGTLRSNATIRPDIVAGLSLGSVHGRTELAEPADTSRAACFGLESIAVRILR
jgi:hypothetical protein